MRSIMRSYLCGRCRAAGLVAGGVGRPVFGTGGPDGLDGRMGGQEPTSRDWDGLSGGFSSRCQGEGRGFESRRPLSVKHLLNGTFNGRLADCGCVAVPMVCPWSPYRSVMTGSLRQRGPDTWELRVCLGVDRGSGRERWATKTVHGSRRHATARLGEFVEDGGYARLRAGTVADLFDRGWDRRRRRGRRPHWRRPAASWSTISNHCSETSGSTS